VLPPFVVTRMVPERPTAQQLLVLEHARLNRVLVVPVVLVDQVLPAFVVSRTLPLLCVMRHSLVLGQETP